jgi:hypothetical protein
MLLDRKLGVCSHCLAADTAECMPHISVFLMMWLNERSGAGGHEHQFINGMDKFKTLVD